MPSAGDKIRASDVRRYLGSASRSTSITPTGTTEVTLGLDVAFTLTSTRRVRVELACMMIASTAGVSNYGEGHIRGNTTGAAVATTDALKQRMVATGNYDSLSCHTEELLAAGTYAYGAFLQGSTTTAITNDNVGVTRLDVWDMGDS